MSAAAAGKSRRGRRRAIASRRQASSRETPGSGVGLALAGGGPLGAIYEIGALSALTEALEGLDFNSADVYVGVSAGGFVGAGLVNGFTPHQMSRVFIEGDRSHDRFEPSILLRPAFKEFAQRLASVPPLLAAALWHYALGTSTMMSAFERLGRAAASSLIPRGCR